MSKAAAVVAAGSFGSQFNGFMQPFDDSLYSGYYSSSNNWAAKTSSLTKAASFSWGLGAAMTSHQNQGFNSMIGTTTSSATTAAANTTSTTSVSASTSLPSYSSYPGYGTVGSMYAAAAAMTNSAVSPRLKTEDSIGGETTDNSNPKDPLITSNRTTTSYLQQE